MAWSFILKPHLVIIYDFYTKKNYVNVDMVINMRLINILGDGLFLLFFSLEALFWPYTHVYN